MTKPTDAEEAARHWDRVADETEAEARAAKMRGSWTATVLMQRAREARDVAARIRRGEEKPRPGALARLAHRAWRFVTGGTR